MQQNPYFGYSEARLWEIYLDIYLRREKTRLRPRFDSEADKEFGELSSKMYDLELAENFSSDFSERVDIWLIEHAEEWKKELDSFL